MKLIWLDDEIHYVSNDTFNFLKKNLYNLKKDYINKKNLINKIKNIKKTKIVIRENYISVQNKPIRKYEQEILNLLK